MLYPEREGRVHRRPRTPTMLSCDHEQQTVSCVAVCNGTGNSCVTVCNGDANESELNVRTAPCVWAGVVCTCECAWKPPSPSRRRPDHVVCVRANMGTDVYVTLTSVHHVTVKAPCGSLPRTRRGGSAQSSGRPVPCSVHGDGDGAVNSPCHVHNDVLQYERKGMRSARLENRAGPSGCF